MAIADPWATITAGAAAPLAAVALCSAWLASTAMLLPGRGGPLPQVMRAMVVLGLAGYACAALHLLGPEVGAPASAAILALPIMAAVVCLALGRGDARRRVRGVGIVLGPVVAAALLVLWVGLHPFQWIGENGDAPAKRWSDMPIDNWIPLLFATMLQSGELSRPLVGDWLSSDRPPLQSGLYLLFNGGNWAEPGLAYQGVSTWAQLTCLVPLLALLRRGVGTGTRALALVALVLSPLVFFNALYVWPKLLAAGFCAIYHLTLFGGMPGSPGGRRVLAGAAAGLALLAHGGAFFALCGSTLAFLAFRQRRALLALAVVAPIALATYAPWMGYQAYVDPPGNRLVKWHFAGDIGPSDASTAEALRDAYAGVTLERWLDDRRRNIEQTFARTPRFFGDAAALAAGGSTDARSTFLTGSFFSMGYALWLFHPVVVCALLGVAAWRGRRPSVPVKALFASATLGYGVWIVLMFEGGSTLVHQGSYFISAAVMVLAMRAANAASPAALAALAIGNIGLWALAYAPRAASAPAADPGYAVGVVALLALLATAAYAASARLATPGRRIPDGGAAAPIGLESRP